MPSQQLRLIFLTMMLVLCTSLALALDGYTLVSNQTFGNGLAAGAFSKDASSWTLESTGCVTNPCLKNNQAGTVGDYYAYIANSTYLLNSSTQDIVIKGWTKNAIGDDGTYNSFAESFTDATHFYSMGSFWHYPPTATTVRMFEYYRNGGARVLNELGEMATVTPYNGEWYWQVVKFNATHAWIGTYRDSAETQLVRNATKAKAVVMGQGYVGFACVRGCLFDDVEFYIQYVAPPNPTITLSTDLKAYGNYTANPFLINFTGTAANGASQINNCSFYLNSTLNETKTLLNLSTTQNFTLDTTGWQKGYDINVTCVNYNDSSVKDSFLKQVVRFDTIQPQITSPHANDTIFWRHYNNLNFTVTTTDPNNFAFNFTLLRENGTVIANYFNQSIAPQDDFTYNRYFDFSRDTNFTNGKYIIRVEAWDSHTKNRIPDYKLEKIYDKGKVAGIMFNDKVRITSPDLVDISATKIFDRYNFQAEFDKADPILYVECPDVEYLPSSGYRGHLVCFSEGKWVDFEDVLGNIDKLDVRKIAQGRAEIRIRQKNLLERIFSFDSIGDLNYNQRSYTFNVTSGVTFSARDHFTTLPVANFTVTINTTPELVLPTTGNNVTTNLTSGVYTVTVTHPSYATNSTVFNLSGMTNFTFDLYATNSLYIFIYDEITYLPLLQNVTVQVINYANQSHEYTTTSGATFQSGFPTGDYEIRVSSQGYAPRSFYVTVATASTQNVEVFMLNTTPTDTRVYKNIVVVDGSGNGLFNTTVSMRRFYVSCNCYKTVEMTKTNDLGKTFVFAQLYESPYMFQVDYQGTTRKITPQTRLSTLDVYISVPLQTSGIAGWFEVAQGVYVTLSYNETTGLWTYSYSGGSAVEKGRLVVTRQGMYSETLLFDAVVNTSTGIIEYNMTPYINETGTFIGVGYVNSTSGLQVPVATKSYNYRAVSGCRAFGVLGLFLLVLMVTMFAFIGSKLSGGNPSMGIFGALVGLILAVMFSLVCISLTWLVGIIIISVIFMIALRT